jgi:serine/threonine protein kinase
MGKVYLGHDVMLKRNAAIKVIAGEGTSEALLHEALALAQLSHPNVVTIYDVGETSDGVYLVMEYVAGQSLARWSEGNHTTAERIEILRQAAMGLHAAHCQRIVHQDFKPDNVIVGLDGMVRVLDFGIAKVQEKGGQAAQRSTPLPVELPNDLGMTQTILLMGTPHYMPPEQWVGDEITERSDQFAFCATAFQVLFGIRPFESNNINSLFAAIVEGKRAEIPANHDVPTDIVQALIKGLKVYSQARHTSMLPLIQALSRR